MKIFIWLITVVLLTLVAKWEFQVDINGYSNSDSVSTKALENIPVTINLDRVIEAIEQVESGGDVNALGDYLDGEHRAVGCLQIWKIYVLDVNRISGRKFSFEDRLCKAKSYEMARIYLQFYARSERIGHEPTAEDYARIHNGGPNGYKKECTIPYWNKVKSILN